MKDKEQDLKKELDEYLENLQDPPRTFERGQIVKGKVLKVKKGEVTVDVGARAEGVVLGKELKLDNEAFDKEIGDEVLVYVLKGENEFGQVELSIRRTGTARKWYDLASAKENNKPVVVEVIEANTGGVIVSIGGGLRGFIPASQLDPERIYPTRDYSSKEVANKQLHNKLGDLIGQEIDVKVMEIDKEKNRVILSEKQLISEDDFELREETLQNTKINDVLEGVVTGITHFGLFVNAQGLEGLVHLSEISWDKVSNPADFYKVGDKVKVKVIGMQDNGKRVAYSIKQLQPDPWDKIVGQYKVGQEVAGVVTKVVDYGAFVRVDDKVNGLIHISEMSDKLVKNPGDYVKEGDEIKIEIISISREERHLGLSLKRASKSANTKAAKDLKEDSEKKIKNTKKEETKVKVDQGVEMQSLNKILGEE